MEMRREVLLSTHHIWKDLGKTGVHTNPIPLFLQDFSSQKRQKGEEIISQADV
jgi:hypothetical protein